MRMCYNTESSLFAWIIANSIALYLFYRNQNYDRWSAGFILVFTTIQLLEAGIWQTIPQSKTEYNSLLTQMVLLILLLQPLAQTYLGARFTNSDMLYYLSFIYLGIFLWALFFRIGTSSPGQFYSTRGPQGHLVWHDSKAESAGGSFLGGGNSMWGWIVGVLYLIGLFVPLLFAECRGIPLLIVGVGTALYSLLISKSGEFSSLWCFYAIIYAVVAIFV